MRRKCWTKDKVPKHVRPIAETWNDMVTVGRYHGVKQPRYILEQFRMAYGRLIAAVPATSRWRWKWPSSDQLNLHLRMLRPEKKSVLRYVKLWRYKWTTVYSGVGGENAKRLAEVIYDLDRDKAKTTGKRVSKRLLVRKLNLKFRRSYYYYVETYDSDLKEDILTTNYYFKGRSATFSLEIIDRKEDPADDAVTRWRLKGKDPELRVFLDSIDFNDNDD